MSAKRSGLGRGLDALLGTQSKASPESGGIEREIANGGQGVVLWVPVDRLTRGSSQPRHEIDPEGIKQLSQSISSEGVLSPLIVRKHPEKKSYFEIIAGERRWRAARLAGLEQVPVLVRDVEDRTAMVLSLVENIQREDLSVLEQAEAYKRLAQTLELSQEELAARVGKQRSSVTNIMRLLKLPAPVRAELQAGRIEMGHARAILGLESAEQMVGATGKVVRQGLSVRQTEALVRRLRSGAGRSKKSRKSEHAPYPELAEQLRRKLGTKIVFNGSEKRGRLEIHYFSQEELERIIDFIDP
ncbi:MAG: ParB/RepB/Spo0J family partition protein [Candidatus Alcyoniella australis]|nr:ParB/RepB/Spo0J family partition protein [Candidatus Alcyoniella australis]